MNLLRNRFHKQILTVLIIILDHGEGDGLKYILIDYSLYWFTRILIKIRRYLKLELVADQEGNIQTSLTDLTYSSG